jgi:hypothetical protein
MPVFVDDLVYTMTGHHLTLPEMSHRIKKKNQAEERFVNTYPTFPSQHTNPKMQDFYD